MYLYIMNLTYITRTTDYVDTGKELKSVCPSGWSDKPVFDENRKTESKLTTISNDLTYQACP